MRSGSRSTYDDKFQRLPKVPSMSQGWGIILSDRERATKGGRVALFPIQTMKRKQTVDGPVSLAVIDRVSDLKMSPKAISRVLV